MFDLRYTFKPLTRSSLSVVAFESVNLSLNDSYLPHIGKLRALLDASYFDQQTPISFHYEYFENYYKCFCFCFV